MNEAKPRAADFDPAPFNPRFGAVLQPASYAPQGMAGQRCGKLRELDKIKAAMTNRKISINELIRRIDARADWKIRQYLRGKDSPAAIVRAIREVLGLVNGTD